MSADDHTARPKNKRRQLLSLVAGQAIAAAEAWASALAVATPSDSRA